MRNPSAARYAMMKRKFLITTATTLALAIGLLAFSGGTDIKKTKRQTETVQLQPSDVLFQDLDGPLGKAIKLATNSEYSHCAIVLEDGRGLFAHEAVEPVRRTSIKDWIDQGVDDHYEVRRLPNASEVLTDDVLEKMLAITTTQLGKHYDGLFEWSDERIYCSELVWMAYAEGAGIEL